MATARASVRAPAAGESFDHMRYTTPHSAAARDTHLFQTSTTSSDDDEPRRGDSLYSGGNSFAASDDGSSFTRSRYQSARDRVSFLSKTPIEEFVAKYQVVKSSWRGKYERILALAPTRFCTIDPKDFEVTNTWSLNALLSISLEASDPEGFTLLLRGQKKEEQLKLRCRFRSRLLSDLYRLQDQALQRRSALENQFSCSKWSRKDVMLSCTLEIGMDGVTCSLPDGSMRSKYLYVDMEHLTTLSDTRDGFAFGYTGRSRLFFSDQRSRIMQRIQAAAEAIGCMIYAKNNASALTTMASIKQDRVDFGKSVGAPFVQFNVQKITVKYEDPVNRVLLLHEKHLVELDVAGDVVSCVEYQQIGVLVRHQKSVEDFEIQYRSGETRRYESRDRDGVLAAIYDLCVTCNENPELFISCAVNERGLRLLPFFAVEDAVETTSFFGDSSIGSCFLQRMSSVAKMGSSQKLGDKGFLEIVAEFNANVPASGLIYNTKQSVITDALRPLGAQLYYLSKAKPLSSRSAVTLLQALCRIASSYYGFREVAQVGQMADSITNLLRNGDEFAVFWTTLLLRKLTAHVVPMTINLDESSIKFCEEVEAYNKTLLFGNSYLVQSLIVHLEGIDVDQKTSKRSKESRSSRARRVGPLVVMGLLQTFEGCLCSRKFTTGASEFQVLVGEIAKHYSTLLKVLFQSRCATTVEACTLLLKATLEECDPAVAMQIRDAALVEGIVLRHVYQAIFDDSFDQRCVSRYLISLWMSHHTPSMQLLARILPPGFFPFLDEPPTSASELEKFDQIELEAIGMEREDTFEFDDDDRMSLLSEMSSAHDETAEPMDESKFFGSDLTQEGLHKRSASTGEINESPSVSRMTARRLSASASRSTVSDPRSSVSWVSATVRESLHTQIENDHTKARMLQKLQSSSTVGRPTTRAANTSRGERSHQRQPAPQTNLAPRVRKRDIAYGFISGALSKAKLTDKPLPRRSSKSHKDHSHSSKRARREENFRLLFFMLSRDHERVDLIWNKVTRGELRRALFLEIERFSRYQISYGNGKALWNYEDFRVHYPTLASEVVIGGCYARIVSSLLQKQAYPHDQGQSNDMTILLHPEEDKFVVLPVQEVPVRDAKSLIAALYRRILRENIRAEYYFETDITIMCIKSLAIVSAAHSRPTDATDFEEIDYLTTLITNTVHTSILQNLLQVIRSLCLYQPNARRLATKENSMNIIVKILQMAHASDRDHDFAEKRDEEKIWLLERRDGDVFGPMSVTELKQMQEDNVKEDLRQLWIHRRPDRVSDQPATRTILVENMQLRWEVGLGGSLDSLQMAHDAASILLDAARSNSLLNQPNATTSIASGDGGIYPAPRAKCLIWGYVRKIIPLLLKQDHPKLCHKIAVLLEFLYSDQLSITRSKEEHGASRSSLFYWGLYFMVFVADTPDFGEIAGLLKSTHLYQSGFGGTSALMGILPESMISYLLSSSPSEFSQVFCDESNSASVIWNQDMRERLCESCLAHLQDFITILQEDVASEWKFCHMAPVTFEELNEEVWCGGVYLGKFCAKEDFAVKDPLEFMTELARRWRAEVGRKKAAFDKVQAATHLGLDLNSISDNLPLIREGFRQKAMELEASVHPSLEYDQRLESLKEAYGVLICPRPSLLTEGHDPVNLLLLLKSFVVICDRYPADLNTYEFDCYDLLLSLLESHCSAEGVLPPDTSERQRMEISLRAAELLRHSCAVSAYNGHLLLDQSDLSPLEKVANYCVNALVEGSIDGNPELLEICFFIMQTVTGLLASERGRSWITSSKTLIVDMVRILWVWNQSKNRSFYLSKIAQQVLEGISRMALLDQNQDLLLQRGVLWQLIMLCSQYNIQIDDTTVRMRLQSSVYCLEKYSNMENEAQNLLAIMAVRAICRLGGTFAEGSELMSPKHARVKAVVDALLTPNLAGLLILSSHHEYLKLFHTNCESYTLVWTEAMRKELFTFVAPRAAVEPSLGVFEDYLDAIRFRFEYLANTFNVGGLYIQTLMESFVIIKESAVPSPVPELGLTELFFKDLFAFIDSGELKQPTDLDEYLNEDEVLPFYGWRIEKEQLRTNFRVTALDCLAVISFVVPSFVVRNIIADVGLIKMILRLLFPPDNDVHQAEDTENSILFPADLYEPSRDHCLAILESLSCIDAFGHASSELGICDVLIEIVHFCKPAGPEVLRIIRNLCAHGARVEFVTEILHSGCYLEFIAWLLLVEDIIRDEDYDVAEQLRLPCAEILAEIGNKDALMSEEARELLTDIFPISLMLQLVESPQTFIEFYEVTNALSCYRITDHENPELVWNTEFRAYLRNHVVAFLNTYYSLPAAADGEEEDGEQPQPAPTTQKFHVDYFSISPYPMAGNVHLPLFLKNPTFDLRDPLYFVTCLWDEFEILVRELAHITSALRQTMSPDDDINAQRGFELLDLATSCLVCVIQVNPWLLDNVASMRIPEYCSNFFNEAVRHQSGEPCVINVVRLLRIFSTSRTCVAALKPVISTVLTCLMSSINPHRRGALHYESGYVLEIMRRIVQFHPEHGERDATSGIVFIASRLDLFSYFLNILDNPESLGTVKEPLVVRAAAIEILNMLEKDPGQASTAHQILKKHKKWEKKYRHESTTAVKTIMTEDPFLLKVNPLADKTVREFLRFNPPRARPIGMVAPTPQRHAGPNRNDRVSMLQQFRESPGPVSGQQERIPLSEKKKISRRLFR